MNDEERKNKIVSLFKNHDQIAPEKKKISIPTRLVVVFLLTILILLSFGIYEFFSRQMHIYNLELKVSDLESKLKKYLKEDNTDVEEYKKEFLKLKYKTKRLSIQEVKIKAALENQGDSDLSKAKVVSLCFLNGSLGKSQAVDVGSIGKNQEKSFDFTINCMPQQHFHVYISDIEFAETQKSPQ